MTLKPLLIDATSTEIGYTRLLGGPPQSVSMRSGKVILQPGETVGLHSTNEKEEFIIILDGEDVSNGWICTNCDYGKKEQQ